MNDVLLAYEDQSLSQARIPGLGKKSAAKLSQGGIQTVRDLVWSLPRDYLDFSHRVDIASAQVGARAFVSGRIIQSASGRTYKRRIPFCELLIDDGSGSIRSLWYNQSYLAKRFVKGTRIALFGKVEFDRRGRFLSNPRLVGEAFEARIQPVYRQFGGLKSDRIAAWIAHAVEGMPDGDPLEPFLGARDMSRKQAFRLVHQPNSSEDVDAIRSRESPALKQLIFEELVFFQWGIGQMAPAVELGAHPLSLKPKPRARFEKALPFQLTNDQNRVMESMVAKLIKGERIFALLQGDVGSGKTLVALFLATLLAESGAQSAILCPTSVLAEQHARTAQNVLEPLGVRSALLTSRMTREQQNRVRADLASGKVDLVLGTHRLIQDDVAFRQLALAVVDEQHRFGVGQRSALLAKGAHPHYVALSATPIPRSLAMALYAGYEVFQIRQKPSGRMPVRTILKKASNRDEVIGFARDRAELGDAVFWVFPLIEGDDDQRERSAVDMHQVLSDAFPRGRVGLVHGRLDRDEIAATMQAFREGRIDVLVATTVIEVGVDVPRATTMVVDGADRFGLSQLHQLRGRIGRGDRPAFCFLIVEEPVTKATLQRLRVMEGCDDGFEIAEVDLRNRGFGSILGRAQTGFLTFRSADPWMDRALWEDARRVSAHVNGDVSMVRRWFRTYPFAR